MSTPVVVQGTAIQPAFGSSPQPVYNNGAAPANVEHEPAKGGCKDPIFAILLYINVAAIAAVAIVYGPNAFADTSSESYNGYIYAAVISCFLSLILSAVGLAVLMAIPETMIKVALIFVVIMAGVWAAMAFVSGSIFAGVLGVIFFAISVCYARAVWSRYVEQHWCKSG